MSHTDRLESWKEIAAYLGKGVRTVSRWEKTEGLPVRRHQHERRASVYALKSELDAWRSLRAPTPAPPPARPGGNWLTLSAAALLVLITALLLLAESHQRPALTSSRSGPASGTAPTRLHAWR
jgi:hypothetical protein